MAEEKEKISRPVEKIAKSEEAEEILQMVNKGIEFTKELLGENERLRFRAVQLQEEIQVLKREAEQGGLKKKLEEEVQRLEQEKKRLLEEYRRVEEQNREYAMRYIEVEEENNNLANLYVCSYQLHLDFNEVLQIIMEIIINLIGAEEFGIYLLEEKTQRLRAVAMEGRDLSTAPVVLLGQGVIGRCALTGENYSGLG